MHNISRSLRTIGLMAIAGATLTACGDKVNVLGPGNGTGQTIIVQPPPTQNAVTGVTVTPQNVQLSVGQSAVLTATVQFTGTVSDLTVTWSSSDPTVATVDATGKVTAVKAGVASIIATSKANTNVRGTAAVTVTAAVVPTVNISSITQFGTNNPVNTQNVQGQIDVLLNVDQAQALSAAEVLLVCGNDTLRQRQSFAAGAVAAPAAEASASAVPIVLSINTAQFDSTGKTALKNGTCNIVARGITPSGAVVANTTQSIVLNNQNYLFGTITTPKTANDQIGQVWNGGDVTVTVVPVVYTAGTTFAANPLVTLSTGKTDTLRANGNGTYSATFPNSTSAAQAWHSVAGITVNPLTATVNFVTSNGQPFVTGNGTNIINTQTTVRQATSVGYGSGATASTIRLDNQAPPAVTAFSFVTQNPAYNINADNTGFLGNGFTLPTTITSAAQAAQYGFNDVTAAGATNADNGGVDVVHFEYQYTTSSNAAIGAGSATWTTFTKLSDLPQTSTPNTYAIRVRAVDNLGNTSSFVAGGTATPERFGVDLVAPQASTTNAPVNQAISKTAAGLSGTNGTGHLTIAAVDTFANRTGSGFSATPVSVSITRVVPSGASSSVTQCLDANTQAVYAGPGANANGFVNGTCNSQLVGTDYTLPTADGVYTVTYSVVDQAGNATAPQTLTYIIDNTKPVVSGGVGIPATISSTSAFTAGATDNLYVSAGNGRLDYTGNAIQFFLNGTADPAANVFGPLNRSATVSVTANPFYNTLQTVAQAQAGTAGEKPSQIGIRAQDEAANVSAPLFVAIPANNVPTPTAVNRSDITSFAVSNANAATLYGGTGTPAAGQGTSTVLTATLTINNQTAASPFDNGSVCFYYQSNGAQTNTSGTGAGSQAGEWVQLGCVAAANVTGSGANRQFVYTLATPFTPNSGLYAGNPATLNVMAVGVTPSGAGVFTQGTVNVAY